MSSISLYSNTHLFFYSSEMCQEIKIWDEVETVPLEDLIANHDAFCTKQIGRKVSRKNRTSRLSDCKFLIKIVESNMSQCLNSLDDATIYIYKKT